MSYLIKRYSNRKLYDTERRSYTTLTGIADLIRSGGEEIEVRDETTGQDITAIIMAQIIQEEARWRKPAAMAEALQRLIRGGAESMREMAAHYAPRVASSIRQIVTEGREAAQQGHRRLKEEAGDVLQEIDRLRTRFLERRGLTRTQTQDLIRKIDALNAKLDEFRKSGRRKVLGKKPARTSEKTVGTKRRITGKKEMIDGAKSD